MRGQIKVDIDQAIKRVSCWCCPLQSIDELRKLYTHFPHLWEQFLRWDEQTWRQFRKDYSVRDLTVRFELERNGKRRDFASEAEIFTRS